MEEWYAIVRENRRPQVFRPGPAQTVPQRHINRLKDTRQALLEGRPIEGLNLSKELIRFYHICDQANQTECDLFVSIHFNAYNGRASGTETLISGSTGSLMLGHCIQTNLKAVLNLPNRGLKERPGLCVLRNTVMPAVLVEVCFIDNDFDWRRYDAHRDEAARAIATGIIQYPHQMQGAQAA